MLINTDLAYLLLTTDTLSYTCNGQKVTINLTGKDKITVTVDMDLKSGEITSLSHQTVTDVCV